MVAIQSYTDTKCELDINKTRLNLLLDKKEKLYCKYFPVISDQKEISVDGGLPNSDKMAEYLHELYEIDYGTGKSLEQEIRDQRDIVNNLQAYLDLMNKSLSQVSGIEYQLLYEIAFKGINISKAVENVAEKNKLETQTIWKNYYRKIKKYIKKLKCTVKIQ